MKIIGLTGNSGSGKSSVSKIFSQNGGFIIDADKIAHNNMRPGNAAYNEIIKSFGEEIISGEEIDRKKLGEIVFSDSEKLNLLNEISHKYIFQTISEEIETALQKTDKYKFIVLDAPLLIETGLNHICSEVWVVFADYNTLLDRMVKRDKISLEYAKQRLDSQTPQKELISSADVAINNNDSFSVLEIRVLDMLNR